MGRKNFSFSCNGLSLSPLILKLRQEKIEYQDIAKDFLPQNYVLQQKIEPSIHQTQALNAWKTQGSHGVVVLPTGW